LSGSAGYLPVFTGANSVSSSVIFQSGSNVGIGTITPTVKFDVLGSATSSVSIVGQFIGGTGTSAGGLKLGAYSAAYGGFWSANVTPTTSNYALISSGADTGLNSTLAINFYINNSSIATVTSTGLGIGTVTPTSRLQVKGSGTTSATTALRVENANATSSMVVLDNGNVGIGTTSPSAKLDIKAQGALSTDIAFRVRNSADTFNIIKASGNGTVSIGIGAGNVDVGSNNNFFGGNAGRDTTTGINNNFIGFQAGRFNITGNNNSFFGPSAGYSNTTGGQNSFYGISAGYNNTTASENTAVGINSGFSNTTGGNNSFFGNSAGRFLADGVTANSITTNSIFIGYNTKALANNQTNQTVIGHDATGLGSNTVVLGNDSILTTALKGNVGIGTTSPSAKLDVSGSVSISGSLGIGGNTRILSPFNTAASGSALSVYGSGSAQPIFTVQGSQGELFSITDSLSGSLFSVNDISGLPILEVFSDNTTLIGNYQDPMLITTAKVVQTNSGSFTVYSLPTASYDTAFFEYSIRSGSNARAGTIMAIQAGSAVNFTETTTTDFGDTTAVSFTVIVTGSNMALTGSSTSGAWTIKTIVRGL
jgi:hypothetical protein